MGAEWTALYVRISRLALLLLLATALTSSFARACPRWERRFAARWIRTRGGRIFVVVVLVRAPDADVKFQAA